MAGHKVMELEQYIKALLRYWKQIILLFAFSICISAIVVYYVMIPIYEAKTTFMIEVANNDMSLNPNASDLIVNQDKLKDYLYIIKSRTVIEAAINDLNLNESYKTMKDNISVGLVNDTRIFELKVQYNDRVLAKAIAGALIEACCTEIGKFVKNMNIKVIDAEYVSDMPIKPKTYLVITMTGIFTILLCMFIVFLMENFNSKLRTADDFESTIKTPVLGMVPGIVFSSTENDTMKGNNALNTYRMIFAGIYSDMLNMGYKRLGVAGFYRKCNKEALIFNFGKFLQQKHKKILIIDTDAGMPGLHKYYRVSNEKGFTDVVFDHERFGNCLQNITPNTDILPAGLIKPKTLQTLDEDVLRCFYEEIDSLYDMILLNLPPIISDADKVVSLMHPGALLLTAGIGTISSKAAKRAVELIRKADIDILGTVIENKRVKEARNCFEIY